MGISEPLEASRGHAFATHAPSISSAASTMGGGRVRFVRLIRRPGESYGFSLRGGREHGTGFFISHVEVGSEAYMQGLRVRKQRFCSSFFIVFLFVTIIGGVIIVVFLSIGVVIITGVVGGNVIGYDGYIAMMIKVDVMGREI